MAAEEFAGGADAAPPIVAIGASAGGIPALQKFLAALPPDLGAAYIVITHLTPKRPSELAAVLAHQTSMPVSQVTEVTELRPNHVYVAPPDQELEMSRTRLGLVDFKDEHTRRAPIDWFFRHLADQRCDIYAVLLSGAGADGAIGLKAIKECGGLVLVQDPNEAEFPSMPRNAIASGISDFVLPVRELAGRLSELLQKKNTGVFEAPENFDEAALARVLVHVRVRTGHDFSQYKRATIQRRVARRMEVTNKSSLAQYFEFLRADREEVFTLLNHLLVSVTTFFRDREAFEVLAKEAIPYILERRDPSNPIRIWVPGCATGEEAYSLAIVFLEYLHSQEIRPELNIFATDLDVAALAVARAGFYPASIQADVSENRLNRFFVNEGDGYRVKRELRDVVLFANHSVVKDPPFSHVDLVSCRNLLIYLDRDLQNTALGIFHYALNPHGLLFLGSAETAETSEGLFRVYDRNAHIFQGVATGEGRLLPRMLGSFRLSDVVPNVPLRTAGPLAGRTDSAEHRAALENAAPPSILVDATHRALHLSESAGRYLEPAGGSLTAELSELVRPELRFEVRSALHHLFSEGKTSFSLPIPVRFNGHRRNVHLYVKPGGKEPSAAPTHGLVMFIEADELPDTAAESPDDDSGATARRLREELQAAYLRLQTTREEAELATESLRAANEELQSINEEYRSTSEELETSKEELQSMNEELQTVNFELKNKLESVSRAHSDLQNLIASSDVATLFLDPAMRIRRFTQNTKQIFNLSAHDEGRPITDLTHNLRDQNWLTDAHAVLRDLTPLKREVRTRKGDWYEMRVRPYRTIDGNVDGIVISFVDMTERLKHESALMASKVSNEILIAELKHRTSNLMAVVSAISGKTIKHSKSFDDYQEQFGDRLQAMARLQGLLARKEDQSISIRDLLTMELTAVGTPTDGTAVAMNGPETMLPPNSVQILALAIHELATNALKYGALAAEGGHLHLEWAAETRDDEQPWFRLQWLETYGPGFQKPVAEAAEPPSRAGQGLELLRRALPRQLDAEVAWALTPTGVHCTIAFPTGRTRAKSGKRKKA